MKNPRLFLLALLAFAPIACFGANVSMDDVIAKARAYLGDEHALDAVTSLTYSGRVELHDVVDGAPREVKGTIELVVQKPGQRRITQIVGNSKEIVGLDGQEGWVQREEIGGTGRPRVAVVDLARFRRMQADTYENLAFFRGIEKVGGRRELRGETKLDGHDVVKIAFVYGPGIEFVRYIDRNTGQLLLTEVPGGELIREAGEKVINGIRFPTRLTQTGKASDGTPFTFVVEFDSIKVNEKYDPAIFTLKIPGID